MGKCSAEQWLAFLLPQVHHGLRTQVRWVVEVSAARGWKWQWALQLLWGWQAAAMAGHLLLASCLPQGHQPSQQLHQTNHTSSKLHTAVLCPRAVLTPVGLWLLIPVSHSDLLLLWFLPVQKPSGASGFSSHSTWVLESCTLPLHLQIVKTPSRQMLKVSTWTLPLHTHCNVLLWLCHPSAQSCWSLGCRPWHGWALLWPFWKLRNPGVLPYCNCESLEVQ